MNEENLKNRIKAADPAANSQLISETVVVEATRKGKNAPLNFRVARFSLAGAAAVVLAVGLTLPSTLAPQPLFTLAGAAQSGNQAGALAATSEMADAKMIWPGWTQYNYIADGLSDQSGRGMVYEIRKVGDPLEILQRAATYFGISGTAKEDDWSTKEYPSYSITGDDFYLSIYWSGAGYWNFGRWTNQVICADSSDAADSATKECIPPQPEPGLIPSKPELIEQTITTFAAFDITVTEQQLTVQRDDWGAYVTVSNSHNGQPIPIDFYIAWDSQGKISSVSAASFEVVERGEFGTVSAVDAVSRIKDGRWYGGVSSKYFELNRPVGTAKATDAAVTLPAPEEGSADQPVEPVEPEIVDLTVNKAESVLVSVFDSAGNMWLVPGYLLFNDQGWFDSIVSLEEGVIQLPEPYDVMPMEEEPAN